MYLLSAHPDESLFPPVEQATPEGLLAIGGDLSPQRLLGAYRRGIFPWYSEGQPILWWSPDPRAVLYLDQLRISRSLGKTLRKEMYQTSFDQDFANVIENCAAPRRNDPIGGTWITNEMIDAYRHLHQSGYAHSVETWRDGELVGGLYGIALGKGFFGESMFTREPDASKVALVSLVEQLKAWDFCFIDCQLSSHHVLSLGAQEIPRKRFLRELAQALSSPDRIGRWDETEITNP